MQFAPERDSPEARSANGIQVIARAAAILRELKGERVGLSLGEIAERVRLPRATVQRIVKALVTERLVIMARPNGGFRLGPEIQSLAKAGKLDIAEFVRPYLLEMSEHTGETVDLAIFRGDHLIFIDQVVGTQRLRAVSAVGESFPLTITANGKACLSLLETGPARKVIEREMSASGSGSTKRRIEALMAELEKVRQEGVAYDLDEHAQGISAAGFAFTNTDGSIYAISIPVPSSRFVQNRDALAASIVELRAKLIASLS